MPFAQKFATVLMLCLTATSYGQDFGLELGRYFYRYNDLRLKESMRRFTDSEGTEYTITSDPRFQANSTTSSFANAFPYVQLTYVFRSKWRYTLQYALWNSEDTYFDFNYENEPQFFPYNSFRYYRNYQDLSIGTGPLWSIGFFDIEPSVQLRFRNNWKDHVSSLPILSLEDYNFLSKQLDEPDFKAMVGFNVQLRYRYFALFVDYGRSFTDMGAYVAFEYLYIGVSAGRIKINSFRKRKKF